MEAVLRWMYIYFFVFSCLFTGPAFAPVGEPGMFVAPTIDKSLNLSKPRLLSAEDLLKFADELNFFDPYLLVAIAKIESDLQPKVTSLYKGITYYGLMQMSYGTAQMVGFQGKATDLMNWRINARLAAKYLEILYVEHGSTSRAVAAYNAGTVIPCKKCTDKSKVVNQDYVDKVMQVYQEIKPT